MRYLQGFIIPVSESKRAEYQKLADESAPFFAEFGAQRTVENWGDMVPRGETTDMFGAVKAEGDENVVFSWIEWESEAACNKAHDEMTQDERMAEPPEMPFDGMRMVYAGFDEIGADGAGGTAGYVQGYVAPVTADRREDFAAMSGAMRAVAVDAGALRAADYWSDKIEDGEVTDFKRAVNAEAGEAVAFGFVEWPSKEAFETGSAKMREDSRMPAPGSDMPIDGKRLIFGGFEVMLDTNADG